MEGESHWLDASATGAKPVAVNLLAVELGHGGDEDHQPESVSQHAGEVKARLTVAHHGNIKQAPDLANERIRQCAHGIGIESFVACFQGLRDPLRGMQGVKSRVRNVRTWVIARVGSRLHAMQHHFGIGAHHTTDMGVHRLLIGRQLVQFGEALVPDPDHCAGSYA